MPPATAVIDAPDLRSAKRAPRAAAYDLPPTVWLLDEDECPEYDRYVAAHPRGSFFQSLAWCRVLAERGCGRARYLLALRGDAVVGVLPLFETLDPAETPRLVSLPDTPDGGALCDDPVARWLLESRALTLADLRRSDGVLVSGFRPWAPAANDPPASSWIRLAAGAVIACDQAPAAADSFDGFETAGGPFDSDESVSPDLRSVQIALRGWARSDAPPRQARLRDPQGNILCRAVWLREHDQIRLLTWQSTGAHRSSALHFLRRIAESEPAGARWLELPVHAADACGLRSRDMASCLEVLRLSPLRLSAPRERL